MFEGEPFVKETRRAQRNVLLSRQLSSKDMKKIKKIHGKRTLLYTLDKGWISSMLGAVEVRGKPHALVTLHPEDPEIFVAVRKPSRDVKEPFLTDEREAQVIREVKKMLTKGLPLNKTSPPMPELKKAKLFYVDEGDGFIF